MKYYSTNKTVEPVSFEEAIFQGLPADNGLFMPETIEKLPKTFFEQLPQLSIQEIGLAVAQTFIDKEIPTTDLLQLVTKAINFDAPLNQLEKNIYSLELFHGPTLAFKDFGARFMAQIMGYFLNKIGKNIQILVATSGDTGSAVAQGFLNVPGITVTILYPKGKVSPIQEMQLTTLGGNIRALEIDGTFDDCQKLVKMAFLNKDINDKITLSSANSINIARLIPQSFYYFYAYKQAILQGAGEVVFCTPSGNFGNLCGGLIAFKLGLPVKHFIAATNINNIIPSYLKNGQFNPKPSVQTFANAMDVGNPSNFPRLTQIFNQEFDQIQRMISGAYYDDETIIKTIKKVFAMHQYLVCPHSAIGYEAISSYIKKNPHQTGIFLATAHPAKFGEVLKHALDIEPVLPSSLANLLQKKKVATPLSASFSDFQAYLLS